MQCAAFSLPCLLSLWSAGSRRVGFCSQGMWAQQLGHVGSAVGVRGLRSWGTGDQQLGHIGSAVGVHGLSSWGTGAQRLGHVGSEVAAPRLQSTGSVVVAHELSCSTACGLFPDQGQNPLHWQEDSLPLSHQGSPSPNFFKSTFYCSEFS